MILKIKVLLYIYIYREKKVFYNIEGQLRGFQLLDQPKTCAWPNKQCYKFNICTRAKALKTSSKPSHPRCESASVATD